MLDYYVFQLYKSEIYPLYYNLKYKKKELNLISSNFLIKINSNIQVKILMLALDFTL